MRLNTVASLVALSLGGVALTAGGAVATTLITSSQIKDGTIQSRDVNATFRAMIVNRVPKLVTKTVTTEGTDPAASILCPSGTSPVGGGYRISGWSDPSSVLIPVWNGVQTNSSGIPVGWRVQFHSAEYQDLIVGVQVLCQTK